MNPLTENNYSLDILRIFRGGIDFYEKALDLAGIDSYKNATDFKLILQMILRFHALKLSGVISISDMHFTMTAYLHPWASMRSSTVSKLLVTQLLTESTYVMALTMATHRTTHETSPDEIGTNSFRL
ncbi:hypothetical protein CHS0354_012702 [Potamilus streckersoni]|uniref:Uncharacterized protein n=1 Tax=Potamilus streckersoni TaxID=2493646 RepID=A0AAE0SY07_9BIVA|nr:hypothetical protein CHS0354_012702 [Potamilus streckersoni]